MKKQQFTGNKKMSTILTLIGVSIMILLTVTKVERVIDGIYENISLAEWNRFDDAGNITLGICLILLSMAVRCGAELEQR